MPYEEPVDSILMGYRPRSPWDMIPPVVRQAAGLKNPFPDPIGSTNRRMMGLPAWRSAPMDYIDSAQEESLKDQLGRGMLTSLGWLGSTLDKYTGSRALKGAMAGKWDELLSILPGSDKFGLTDPTRATSAREALGIEDDHYSRWDDVASFAGEVLLDPTLPLSGFIKGGLTAGGKALRAAGGLKDVDYALQTARLAAGAKETGKLATRGATTLREGLAALPDAALKSTLAERIGKTAGNRSLADEWLDQPIGKSLEFGVPFSSTKTVGFNVPGLDKVRDSAFKLIGDTVGVPIKKHLWAPVKGMSTAAAQKVAAVFTHKGTRLPKYVDHLLAMYHAEQEPLKAAIKQAEENLTLLKADPAAPAAALQQAEQALEAAQRAPLDAAIEHYRRLEGVGGRTLDPQNNPLDAIAEMMQTTAAANRKRFAFGEPLDDLNLKFFHRSFRDPEFFQKVSHEIQPMGGWSKDAKRSAGLRMIPGGTGDVMEIASDPDIIAASKTKVGPNAPDPLVAELRSRYAQKLPNHFPQPGATVDELRAAQERLDDLVRILRAAPKEQMAHGLFHHPAVAAEKYLRRQADLVGVAEAQLELVARTTRATEPKVQKILDEVRTQNPNFTSDQVKAAAEPLIRESYASLADYFQRVPHDGSWLSRSVMKPTRPIAHTLSEAQKLGNPLDGGGYVEYITRYGTDVQKRALDQTRLKWDTAVRSGNPQAFDQARTDLLAWAEEFGHSVRLPKRVFDDMVRWEQVFVAGDQIGDLGKFVDSWTSMFKASVLTRPSRYTRDLTSGQLMSMMLGQWSPGVAMRIGKYMKTGVLENPKEFMHNIVPATQLAAMSDAEALQLLNAHITTQWTGQGRFLKQSQIGAAKEAPALPLDRLSQEMFGKAPIRLKNVAEELKLLVHPVKNWRAYMPWEIKGVNPVPGLMSTPTETVNAFVRAGEAAGKLTDTANVLVPYLTLLKRGVAPDEAMRRVLEAQVDYSAKSLTSLEKNILVRAFPFWRFTSKMLPFVVTELMNRPAGLMAQTIRLGGKASTGEHFVPQQLRDTMAIPVSSLPFGEYLESKDPARQRYFTGLGLMHEDVTSLFEPGANLNDTVSNLLRDIGGRMNPYPKALAELAFQKHLFSGRDLRDMQGRAAQIVHDAGLTGEMPRFSPLVENLVSNSPLAGPATFLGTLLDPAKGAGAKSMQLLTGARISDVNREKSQEIALREAIENLMRGKPGVHALRPHLYVPEAERALLSDADLLLMDLYRQQLANAKRQAAARRVEAGPAQVGTARLQEMLQPTWP